MDIKQPLNAVSDFEECLRIDKQKEDAGHDLAAAMISLKRYPETIQFITRRLKDIPDRRDDQLVLSRGNCYLALQRYELAAADYDLVLSRDPQWTEAIGNRGVALRGMEEPEKGAARFGSRCKTGTAKRGCVRGAGRFISRFAPNR